MGRTAIAWGSAAAHNLAAYSQSELGFATHFNMYPEVQLPSPNSCLAHARPGELRDGAIESLDQCGDACVLYLEQKVAHLKWHGQIRWISQFAQQKNLVEFPLTIVRQLRY